MFPISTWYPSLGQYSFPSVFVELKPDEAQALVERDTDGTAAKAAMSRIQRAMRELPGSCFVCADVCAPTDSPYFGRGRRASYGLTAWRLLAGSEKIRTAFTEGLTNRIVVRPYRRMNRTREFRLFFKDGVLQGASQYHLERHFHRLEGREKQLWRRIQRFAKEIAPFLPQQDRCLPR